MKSSHGLASLVLAGIIGTAMVRPAVAETALGDWGHCLQYYPRLYFNNPEGKAFTLTIHPFRRAWMTEQFELPFRVVAPGGTNVLAGSFLIEGTGRAFEIPKGPPGAYLMEVDEKRQWPVYWVESSLGQSVMATGPGGVHATRSGRRAMVSPFAPRLWWFFVPTNVAYFSVFAQRVPAYSSQREDWGVTVFSPRGQRMAILWGQPPVELKDDVRHPNELSARVLVEPGNRGRFWALELRHADSHNYSDVNVALEGVPDYLARSPEEWFDPKASQPPGVTLYDNDPFMQFLPKPGMGEIWTNLMHFSPSPSLGDPEGNQVRGDASFAMWNPDGRPVEYCIADYGPRDLYNKTVKRPVRVSITGPEGRTAFDDTIEIRHAHEKIPMFPLPPGKGVFTFKVSQWERWLAWSYPGLPLVLIGQATDDGYQRFNLEIGTARNWYFHVPKGVKTFEVRARAQHETDVIHLEVNAPDRTLAILYDREGSRAVKVPDGLDGKMWYLRLDVGSATRMVTEPEAPTRYSGIYLTLDLKGVPGYLAPTWEQWFDPKAPRLPLVRGN